MPDRPLACSPFLPVEPILFFTLLFFDVTHKTYIHLYLIFIFILIFTYSSSSIHYNYFCVIFRFSPFLLQKYKFSNNSTVLVENRKNNDAVMCNAYLCSTSLPSNNFAHPSKKLGVENFWGIFFEFRGIYFYLQWTFGNLNFQKT